MIPWQKNCTWFNEKGRESGIFIAGLVQIEGNLYFDFRPFTFDIDDMFHFPVHLFMKASLEDENTIVMHYFNDEWLKGLISNRQVRIRHEINREGAVLLTAPTAELREFVRRVRRYRRSLPQQPDVPQDCRPAAV